MTKQRGKAKPRRLPSTGIRYMKRPGLGEDWHKTVCTLARYLTAILCCAICVAGLVLTSYNSALTATTMICGISLITFRVFGKITFKQFINSQEGEKTIAESTEIMVNATLEQRRKGQE